MCDCTEQDVDNLWGHKNTTHNLLSGQFSPTKGPFNLCYDLISSYLIKLRTTRTGFCHFPGHCDRRWVLHLIYYTKKADSDNTSASLRSCDTWPQKQRQGTALFVKMFVVCFHRSTILKKRCWLSLRDCLGEHLFNRKISTWWTGPFM